MLHGNKKKQLHREKNVRNALLKSMVSSLIKHEKITTTEVKAKVIKPIVEKLVTKGKEGTLSARRILTAKVGAVAAAKIVKEISPRYADRKGGYTRITKLASRISDGARTVSIEFV